MFCPKCATQNLDGASYCRSCGANISLVPHALTGQLPQAKDDDDSREGRRRRRYGKEPSIDHAFKNVFMGVAFLLVSIALSFSIGKLWWFWMLIPAFSLMGTGIAEYIRFREKQKATLLDPGVSRPSVNAPPRVGSLPPRNTGEMVPPPPSITEGTTRHLGAEAQTKHLDASSEAKK
jgi:zinc ribbon protein